MLYIKYIYLSIMFLYISFKLITFENHPKADLEGNNYL